MKGSQDPTPLNIAADLVIIDLRMRVGSIKESNLRKDTQAAETTKLVADQGQILAEKVRFWPPMIRL